MHDVLNAYIDLEEKQYTPHELAKLYKVHRTTITRLFIDEPGVWRAGHTATRTKRQRFTLRIPESVVKRVFARMTVKGDPFRPRPQGTRYGGGGVER
jgi:hypothetical protein